MRANKSIKSQNILISASRGEGVPSWPTIRTPLAMPYYGLQLFVIDDILLVLRFVFYVMQKFGHAA